MRLHVLPFIINPCSFHELLRNLHKTFARRFVFKCAARQHFWLPNNKTRSIRWEVGELKSRMASKTIQPMVMSLHRSSSSTSPSLASPSSGQSLELHKRHIGPKRGPLQNNDYDDDDKDFIETSPNGCVQLTGTCAQEIKT